MSGDHFRPVADLPVGAVFWRVRPQNAPGLTSATWEVFIGPRTAPVESSWGTTLDANGDGYADVLVGHPGGPGGETFFYVGSPTGVSAVADTTLTQPNSVVATEFGAAVTGAGDVDGDGFADAVISTASFSGGGSAFLYRGGTNGLEAVPVATFGIPAAGVGDVDLDGYADIATGNDGAFQLFAGAPSGEVSASSGRVHDPDGAGWSFAAAIAGAGDVNGDGYSDLIVGAPASGMPAGRAYVYLGGADGIERTPSSTLEPVDPADVNFGVTVATAGDVNGDGYADVLVGSVPSGIDVIRGSVFLGGPSGVAPTPAITLVGPVRTNVASVARNLASVVSAGDVNGDGLSDVVLSAANSMASDAQTLVFLGSAAGPAALPAFVLRGEAAPDEQFGVSASCAGDVNGDGFADLIVGALMRTEAPGRAYVFAGGPSGLAPTPLTTFVAPVATYSLYGFAVFGATN